MVHLLWTLRTSLPLTCGKDGLKPPVVVFGGKECPLEGCSCLATGSKAGTSLPTLSRLVAEMTTNSSPLCFLSSDVEKVLLYLSLSGVLTFFKKYTRSYYV